MYVGFPAASPFRLFELTTLLFRLLAVLAMAVNFFLKPLLGPVDTRGAVVVSITRPCWNEQQPYP